METKYVELVKKFYEERVSTAGITSLMYIHGLKGVSYDELRKLIFKECQRIKSEKDYIRRNKQ